MTEELVLIPTGIANMASVQAAFVRLGREPVLSTDPDLVAHARHVVLPGVGAFAAGMEMLRSHELIEPLRRRIHDDRPTLAVCLGLQLLCKTSEESPGIEGLGILDTHVQRFGDEVRVPQIGWNYVEPVVSHELGSRSKAPLLTAGFAYFANSYRLPEIPEGWSGGQAVHGTSFVASLERGNLLACQFHPELSGPWGQELLGRWLEKQGD